LKNGSETFFQLELHFMTFLLGNMQKSKFKDLGFGQESDLHLLGFLPVQKFPRKHHQDRQILPWRSQVQ